LAQKPVLVCTDCEGPITLDDNAFDLARHFIPRGEWFFSVLSCYDDYLAEVERKSGYKAGDTLKLIVPFLIAFGVTNEKVKEFSQKRITFLREAKGAFKWLSQFPVFMISTSYKQYAFSVGDELGIPRESIFCTRIDWDSFFISSQEKEKLRDWAEEISSFPEIYLPPNATSLEDLPPTSQKAVKRLDEIIWEGVASLPGCREVFEKVNPIGGREKAASLLTAVDCAGFKLSRTIYFGDSITDAEALELVKESGGLAVAFNPNRYALRYADLALLSLSCASLSYLVSLFCEGEKEEAVKKALKGKRAKGLPDDLWAAHLRSFERFYDLRVDWKLAVAHCEKYRRKVRGEFVGGLG
jgi:predicted HAD superfamily phosphohydrolase